MTTCIRCHDQYDPHATLDKIAEWDPRDGRCCGCYIRMCYDIFCGSFTPVLRIGKLISEPFDRTKYEVKTNDDGSEDIYF